MEKITKIFEKAIEYLMALSLAIMFLAVFVNVLLRYLFGSGFPESEELSRLLFVWLIFLGATLAVGKNAHIGFDLVQSKLPNNLRSVCFIISRVLMLYGLYLFLLGSWSQYQIGWNITSTVIKYPLAYMYATGLFASIGMGFYLLRDMVQELHVIRIRLAPNKYNQVSKECKESNL